MSYQRDKVTLSAWERERQIGERVKHHRLRMQLSVSQLAHLTQLSTETIMRIETAREPVTNKLAKRLCDVFTVEMEEFGAGKWQSPF